MPLSLDCINVKGAMNPCRCGYYPDRKRCRCTLSEIRQYMFPVRNRLISGLFERVVIVEAAEKSGSLITADFVLEQGREIYVFPGRYDDPLSKGTNRLIFEGAGVILSPEEFVSDLLSIKDTALSFTGGTVKGKTRNLEDDEAIVYSCLDFYPKGFESLSAETGLPLLSLISAVMRLCDRGLVMETFKNEYVKI